MGKLVNKLILLSGITLLTPGVSYAQWYIGIGAGKTNIETERFDSSDTSDSTARELDDNDTYYKLFGGWRATPSFAFEFGYVDLGKYTHKYNSPTSNWNVSNEATAIVFEGVGSIDLGKSWRFLGKLGFAYWNGEVEYTDNTPFSDSGSDSGIDPVLGLGIEYGINFAKTTRMGIRLEWEQYQNIWEDVSFKDESTSTVTFNGLDINTFGLSLTYDF